MFTGHHFEAMLVPVGSCTKSPKEPCPSNRQRSTKPKLDTAKASHRVQLVVCKVPLCSKQLHNIGKKKKMLQHIKKLDIFMQS